MGARLSIALFANIRPISFVVIYSLLRISTEFAFLTCALALKSYRIQVIDSKCGVVRMYD